MLNVVVSTAIRSGLKLATTGHLRTAGFPYVLPGQRARGMPPSLPRPATRRERITAIITSQPPRDWSGHELAVLLHVKPRNVLTQLSERARLGFFTRTGSGTYKLNMPTESTPSTTAQDP